MLNTILNILWLILGGGLMGLVWFLGGVLMAISIIGLPWAHACFTIGRMVLWPFGYEVRERQGEDIGTGALGVIGNVLWFVFAGIWLAIGHLSAALALFVSIIGIPFAFQHLKFIEVSLFPIGKTVVAKDN